VTELQPRLLTSGTGSTGGRSFVRAAFLRNVRRAATTSLSIAALSVVGIGCGNVDDLTAYEARLEVPSARTARVTITPALDLSGVEDEDLARNLVVQQVAIHLADARLLGTDPRIPPGGYPLLDQPRIVYAEGNGEVGIELPFPEEFVGQDDLAVYLRTEPSDDLNQAAVLVVAEIPDEDGQALTGVVDPDGDPAQPETSQYVAVVDPDGDPAQPGDPAGVVDPDGDPAQPGSADSVVDPDGDPAQPGDDSSVVDPDGDPARPNDGSGVVDPDGDPAHPDDGSGVVDPDGDPAHPGQRHQGLQSQGLTVHLIDRMPTELVVSFGERSRFNVVFGIRARNWLNGRTADELDPSTDGQAPGPHATPSSNPDSNPRRTEGRVDLEAEGDGMDPTGRDDEGEYYLGEDIPTEDSVIRNPPGL
jgi:hypothetical protein